MSEKITIGSEVLGHVQKHSFSWGGQSPYARIYPSTTKEEVVMDILLAWAKQNSVHKHMRVIWEKE